MKWKVAAACTAAMLLAMSVRPSAAQNAADQDIDAGYADVDAGYADAASAGASANTVFFRPGVTMPMFGAVNIIGGEGSVMGEVVIDNPYSAESLTESIQVLADGNRITQINRARIYRDSEGRTRREHMLNGIGAWSAGMIVIDDPVAGASYILDPENKTARAVGSFSVATSEATPALAAEESVARQGVVLGAEGRQVFSSTTSENAPSGPAIRTIRLHRAGPSGSAAEGFPIPPTDGSVRFLTRGAGPMSFVSATPAGVIGSTGTVHAEALGEQVLEGVLVEGARETQTIPAGAIGNELPIEVVSERWYSPELEALVSRRTTDPRFGETNYRLVNVVRSEPPPELFMVPQDYEL